MELFIQVMAAVIAFNIVVGIGLAVANIRADRKAARARIAEANRYAQWEAHVRASDHDWANALSYDQFVARYYGGVR